MSEQDEHALFISSFGGHLYNPQRMAYAHNVKLTPKQIISLQSAIRYRLAVKSIKYAK